MATDPVARATFLGRLAATTQIIFGGLLGAVASLGFEPGFVPRGAVLFGTFALPGIVGWIGIRGRRPTLLLAAALGSFVGAFLGFSGVTLIFLAPALLFLVACGLMALTWRPAGASAWLGALVGLGLAGAIVVLVVSAGASALLVTDTGCWSQYQTPTGVRVEIAPYLAGEMEVPPGAAVSGCSSGLLSVRGVGLGVLLGGGAVGLARIVARRRTQVSGSGIHSPSATPTATNSG
jgi:hypothetical protein